ncbi:MAG: InlB B-repeat-containing protein, partial [Kiritimatiellae bacterium]|nr:InlB B-repeat-containing protein [Kiritimatiellia bacterium]
SHPGVDDRDAPEAAGFPSSAQSLKDLRRSRYGWSHLKVPFAAANKDGPDGNYVLCGGTFAANSDGTAFAGRKSGAGVVFADFPLRDDGRIAAPPPFEVSLDPAGGAVSPRRFSVARGSALGRLPVPTRKGYVFLGWYTARRGGSKVAASTLPSRDTALFARWAKAAYAVSFSANGGTLPKGSTMAAQKMTYGKAAKLRKNAFTRKDCVFIGWATSKSGKVVYKNAQAVKNLRTDGKTVTLYAKWAEKTYTVAFNANGGKGTMAAQKMAYGKAAELSPNKFARPGCTFRGWAEKKTGAVAYKNAQSVKNLRTDGKTTTLYAAWAKNAYTVAFNANGGTGTMAKQAMKYGTAANLRANAFKRTGYAFQGWAKTAGGAVVCANRARVKNLRTDGGTTTLYAKWKASTYKIEFDANGGIGSMAAQQMTYGTAAALRANAFKHDGFAFQGWSRTGDGAEAYADQARVKNLGRDGGTVTLYAVWAPDPVPEPSEEPAEETASAPVAVPHEWPEGNAAGILSANGGDYEAAARAKVANGVNTVRECYVAGLDAEDAAQEFTAEISFMDGNPVVSANPGGVEGREYALYGKKDLTDPAEDWADVTDNANPGADGYRFFRVGVSLPEE